MNDRRIQFYALLPAVLIVFAALSTLVVITGTPAALRPVLAFLFLLLVPGLAYARLLPAEDGIILVTLAVALSLAIDTVVAMILLYTGRWSFITAFVIIAVISLVGAVLQARPPAAEDRAREEQG